MSQSTTNEVKVVFNEEEADFLVSAMKTALESNILTNEEREQLDILNEKFKINDELKLKVIQE